MIKIAFTLALLLAATWAAAQGPPPIPPLIAPPAPAGNPVTTEKANLGKVLFWDEQLSSTRTVSCGSCHQPASGGSDGRSLAGTTDHPGADGIPGTADDITGSPGVILNNADGTYEVRDFFGLAVQTTGRYAPSAINAGYADELFWDGRAGETFIDPVSGETVLAAGAALESQVAGPPTSPVEMAHQDRDWEEIAERIGHVKPLAISPDLPTDLETWIADRNYDELFSEAFGSDGVSATRIIMAIATYERTLVSNQAPFDAFIAGNQNALTAQERQGLNLFAQNNCVACHGGNRLTDDDFHYIGVRPQNDDLGRFNVTGRNQDRGRMKTPSLRNAELRGEFMHNGRLGSLADVVDFYNQGGDFDAANKDNNVRPLNLTDAEKAALVAFLGRPLTDPRVTEETGIFSRPSLFAASPLEPAVDTAGVAGSDGEIPEMIAIEPSLAGNPNFTVALNSTRADHTVYLAIDTAPLTSGTIPLTGEVMMVLEFTTDDNGHVSVPLSIPNGNALAGSTLHGKWFVAGDSGPDGESASFSTTVFGESAGHLNAPTNVTGTYSEDTGSVEFNWDAVTDAESYEVFRGTTELFQGANRLGATSLSSFSDNSVTTDVTYNYWIFAVNTHEASPVSEAATVSTIDLSGFSLTATDATSTLHTQLSWETQGPTASYSVLRGDEPNPATMTEIASDISGLTFDDVSGDAARTYYYRVVATVGGEFLSNSEAVAGSRALAPPTNVVATNATFDDRIQITWTGDSEADSYEIYRSELGEPEALPGTTSSTLYDDFTATAARDYTYTIVSVNAYGVSEQSGSATGYKQVQSPTGVTASYADFSDRITLSWNLAESVSDYVIYRSSTSSFSDAVELDTVSGQNSFTDLTATGSIEFTYWVASIDEENNLIFNETLGAVGIAANATPDAMIGKTSSSVKGDEIYNTTGAGQQHNVSTRRYRPAKATLIIQNDGSITDVLRYTSSGRSRNLDVNYTRISPTPKNLTAAMKTGAAESMSLAPGSSEQITVKVSSKRSRKKTYRYSGLVTSTSSTNPGKVDCVKLKTKISK